MGKGFILFLCVVAAVLGVLHFFVWKTAVLFFEVTGGAGQIALGFALTILAMSFILASILSHRSDAAPVRFWYTASAVWLGIFHHLVIASGLMWLVFPFVLKYGGIERLPTLAGVFFLGAAIASAFAAWNANRITVRELSVRVRDLPDSWRGKTAVVFSDVHLGHVHAARFLERVVTRVSTLAPDVVFIPGDLFDGPKIDMAASAAPLKKLHAPLGVYCSIGNHDLFAGVEKATEALAASGVTVLRDAVREVAGVQVIGVDYRMAEMEEELTPILSRMAFDPTRPSIMLHHAPVAIEQSAKAGISLQLSGHSHQGQLWPFNYLTRLVYGGYDGGLRVAGGLVVYTSPGVGTWGPPLRTGSRAEVARIHFIG